MLTITYFYEESPTDVDNVPKPVSDALKGLVYIDDSQVNDVICRRRELKATRRLINPSPVLAERFVQDGEFLYIIVESAPSQEVVI